MPSGAGPPEFGDFGPADLKRAMGSEDPAERAAAIARARFDPEVEQVVIRALQDPDPGVRRASIQALARWRGAPGIKAIIEASTGDPSPLVRAEAVAALGAILGSEKDKP